MTSIQKGQRGEYKMYQKLEMTAFAKNRTWVEKIFIDCICMTEEIYHSAIGQELLDRLGRDENLLIDISRRFAEQAQDGTGVDVNIYEVQLVQNMMTLIIDCCDKHNWFREEKE